MTSARAGGRFLAAATALAWASCAGADTQTYVDVQGNVGYSTNPFLLAGDDVGGGFGRLSLNAFHGWSTPRSTTSLSAFAENSTYFRRYSNQQVFSLNASTSRRASEVLDIYGNVTFSRDVGNQLGGRFFGQSPLETELPDPLQPPGSVIIIDPRLGAFSRKVYRLGGEVGGRLALSPTSSLNASAGIQHVNVTGNQDDLDSILYNGAFGYNRQLNERMSIGARVIADYADYRSGRVISSVGPQATFSTRLSDQWDISGAVGFVRTRFEDPASGFADTSTSLAVDATVCRQLQYDRFCASVSRRAQGGIVGGTPATTAGLNYSRRLSSRDDIQLRGSIVRAGASVLPGAVRRTNFYDLGGSYSRRFSPRLSGGINLSGRKGSFAGEDVKSDVGGSVFLRYRFGDLR